MRQEDLRTSATLPEGWPSSVRSAVLHSIALAHVVIAHARGWAANSLNARVRLSTCMDQLRSELAMLREELRIKDDRMAAILPHRRPHYSPVQRMAILELKAARGWSLVQTAAAFLVEPATVAAWLKRLDESGGDTMVQLPTPVNRFPDFVRYIVQRLKTLCPTMGKIKIAQTLARAGLHLGATTVGRMLKDQAPSRPPSGDEAHLAVLPDARKRIVTARYPNHVWHVDLTVVPMGGFWATWLPFALPQRWPFCWWVACAVDHFSRRVMGVAVFASQPTSKQVRTFLAKTIRRAKATPRYIVCDKGRQFWCKPFKLWCRRRKIRLRFGAIGQHGSIAVVERFIRTMKDECFRTGIVPMTQAAMQAQARVYADWYNRFRVHTTLGGRAPEERYRRIPSACRRPRFEPRPDWPVTSGCASPPAKVRGQPGVRLELVIGFHKGRRNLPIVTLRRVG